MESNPQSPTKKKQDTPKDISGEEFRNLVEAGVTWLKTNQQTVNALNVFPVPDGDTGTNMVLTMQAAINEMDQDETNIGKTAHAIAKGALIGARGNSGVILSQLWRGFARSLDNLEVMDAPALIRAFAEARDTAYKGVVRPVEGTILTVAKDIALAAQQALAETNDLQHILEKVVTAADLSVKNTPELLSILKQAGVVDAGGKGLFYLLEGMLRYLNDQSLETPLTTVSPISTLNLDHAMETIEPGQDYEVVVDFTPTDPLDLESFYNDLSQIGTSIQLGEGDGLYRIHIHVPTEKRYDPIDYTMKLGTISKVSIENLIAQMNNQKNEQTPTVKITPIEPDQIAVIVVSPGMGISRIFASLGVAGIVEGGQSMNPSTEEILKAFENLPTNKVIILPNNKNIILAAKAASEMTVKKVAVVASTSIPQGLNAILRLIPNGDFDEIVKEMNNALKDVDTGEITTATRSVEINGVKVNRGEVIALLNGKLICSTDSLEKACLDLLSQANAEDKERITLFYGANISRTNVNRIIDNIRLAYPTHEIELHEGGQNHYQFIVSIE